MPSYVFDPEELRELALRHVGKPVSQIVPALEQDLKAKYGELVHLDMPWVITPAGFMMYQVKADRTVVNHEEKPQAEVWKDKGNAAYVHLHTNVDLPTPSLSLRLFHLFHSVREVKNQREFDRSDQMMVKQVREKELTDRPFFFFVMWSFQRQV